MSIGTSDREVSDAVAAARTALGDGRAKDAARILEDYIGAGRGGLFASLLLVRARLASGDAANALTLARENSFQHPHVADSALALGEALAATHALPLAIAEFQRALRLDPALDAARVALAKAWLDAGEPAKAEAALAPLESPDPHLLARASKMRMLSRSDAGYVRHLFDQFAASYDERMRAELAYAAPEILRALANLVLPMKEGLEILDLGCGTGLGGAAFKHMARRMVGIDLSPAMLEKARKRDLYHQLILGDIESFEDPSQFDLLIAADTLVYLGDLAPICALAETRLGPQGHFLFTVERHTGVGYIQGEKRRWRHSENYLRETGRAHGLEVVGLLECSPRTERGVPVEGLACAFEKSR